MGTTSGPAVGILSALYVLAWIPVAWMTGVLFPGQMLKKYPEPGKVIPLILDFYVWADLFIFPLLIARVVSEVGDRWAIGWIGFLLVLGLATAVAFQYYVIVPGKYPSTLGGGANGLRSWILFRQKTTLLGWLHMPFFALVFAVMMMFLFTALPTNTVLFVTAVFAVIIPITMLVPLHFVRKWLELEWAPNIFKEEPRMFLMIGISEFGTFLFAALKLVIQRWV
ncbi:MAG: hypothetical protein ACYC75_02270 [Minisyncoccota bacterium]